MMTFKEHAELNEVFPFGMVAFNAIRSAGTWVATNYPNTAIAMGGIASLVGTGAKVAVTKPVTTTAGVYGVAYFTDMEAVMATTEQTVAFVISFALEHGLEITKGIAKGILAELSAANQLKLGVVIFAILYLKYGKKIRSVWRKFVVMVKKLAVKVKLGKEKLEQRKINKALGTRLGRMTA